MIRFRYNAGNNRPLSFASPRLANPTSLPPPPHRLVALSQLPLRTGLRTPPLPAPSGSGSGSDICSQKIQRRGWILLTGSDEATNQVGEELLSPSHSTLRPDSHHHRKNAFNFRETTWKANAKAALTKLRKRFSSERKRGWERSTQRL